jgi:hypothetical protein
MNILGWVQMTKLSMLIRFGILSVLFCLVFNACASDSHLAKVRFKIVAEDTGAPLTNHQLDIYHFVYDVPFDSKESPWYITSVTTDSEGVFTLDLSDLEVDYLVVQPGQPYNIVRFERASDLKHTASADHIKVVRFEAGETRVEANAIYDLKRGVVKIIPISGEVREESYSEILLIAQEYKSSQSRK